MGWLDAARLDGQIETPFFFESQGRRRFAVLHRPDGREETGNPLLVCHPHFEEKLWAHRVLLAFARGAAARGHAVLRYDGGGHGDSADLFEEVGFDALERDAEDALALLRDRTRRDPVAVGLRLGATFAGRLAARHGLRVAMWEPALDPKEWLFEAMRANLTFQLRQHGRVMRTRQELVRDLEAGGTVVIEGYGLTGAFWREAAASQGLLADRFPARCPGVLAVTLARRAPKDDAPLQAAVRLWSTAIPAEYRHVPEDAFWSDIKVHRTQSPELFATTLDWVEGGSTKERAA